MTFVQPAYGDRSLADVVPAVAVALGVAGRAASGLDLPQAPSYVVLLIDGLGEELLRRHSYVAPYLSAVRGGSGTAGVPSTTATSLTSLGTGLAPGQHGLVGYTARVPGTGELLNHLQWDRDVDPLAWQPNETEFSRLMAAGVQVTNVNKSDFAGSGLTRAAHRGATYVGADSLADKIAGAVRASAHGPSVTYVYDSDLDYKGHRYGVASSEWLQQLAAIDDFCEELREALPPAVRLLVVADHGMVDSPADRRIDVDEHPELRHGLTLLGGEARFRHLYCRPGALDDVLATWRDRLGSDATVLTRDEAVGRGWFGPVDAAVSDRLGDVMVACHTDLSVLSSRDFPLETRLIGMHGSLTADEMRIPILVD